MTEPSIQNAFTSQAAPAIVPAPYPEVDEKQQNVYQLDNAEPDLAAAAAMEGYALSKSRFDQLSIPRTLWVFRRAVLVCLAVYTGYVCEGFELGAGGSVVANAGFIKQFGTTDEIGVRGLSTTWCEYINRIVADPQYRLGVPYLCVRPPHCCGNANLGRTSGKYSRLRISPGRLSLRSLLTSGWRIALVERSPFTLPGYGSLW